VEDGVTGFLVEPGSARALAERIAEVRAMPEIG
jgi:glycosyltransferase involved in cell wall biosynthesis